LDNQLQQVKSIQESTAVIKSNEELVGLGLWNIGKELKYIRDNKTYEQIGYSTFQDYTKEELDYSRQHSYKFIKLAESYNVASMRQIGGLGVTKLLELTRIEEEEKRQKFIEQKHDVDGEEKTIDDMTTRELKKVIKEKKELEKTLERHINSATNLERKNVELLKRLQAEKNKEPEVKIEEKEVIKEVVPEDIKRKLQELEQRAGELDKYQDEVKDYEKRKEQISSEIINLKHYMNQLQEENDRVTQQAKISEGICGPIRKLEKHKAEIEQLLKFDIELDKWTVRDLKMKAEFLEELSGLIYSRIIKQEKGVEIYDITAETR